MPDLYGSGHGDDLVVRGVPARESLVPVFDRNDHRTVEAGHRHVVADLLAPGPDPIKQFQVVEKQKVS